MKKKILVFFGVCSLVFILAGAYIIVSIKKTTSDLDNLIKLHQVEILREHLLIRIQRVESDLSLRGTRHARAIDTMVTDVGHMGNAVGVCLACHHSEEVTQRLVDLKGHIMQYSGSISRMLTMQANAGRLKEEEDIAFKTGEDLITEVNTMTALTNQKLMGQTAHALQRIARTESILFFLLATGPLFAGGFAFLFIRGLTKQVSVLVNATRTLKAGDLDYRVGPLEDEFGEVAESFNEMAVSLREHMYRIEQSETRYRMLFEKAGDAIFILDAEGEDRLRILSANEAAARMHGYTADELLTLRMNDIISPDPGNGSSSLIQRILRGEWVKAEVTHRKKDGTVFPVEMGAGLVDLGNHKHILAFDRDVSERKMAEDSLQRAEQLKVAGALAAGLTHEIKNYLAGIKVSAEVLLDELVLSEDHQMVFRNMIIEIRQMELLMKELLNFARPSMPQLVPVTINAILDSAMAFSLKNVYGQSRTANPVTIVKEFGADLPRTMADPMKLQQAFMNLLLNAVDAMPDGGTLSAKTSHDPSDSLILISISDTGGGIGKEVLDKLFEPFFTTKPRGTGLGLPITKRLIEQHGGSIRVESNPASGTTFEVSLPVRQVEEAQES